MLALCMPHQRLQLWSFYGALFLKQQYPPRSIHCLHCLQTESSASEDHFLVSTILMIERLSTQPGQR